MDKIKFFFKSLVFTKIGRLLGSLLFSLLFYIIAYKTDDYGKDTLTLTLLYLSGVLGVIFLTQFIIWLFYGLILNPLRDYCHYKGRDNKFCKQIFNKK